MSRKLPVSELQPGAVVIAETRYQVRGIDQAQGQVQVADVTGNTHTYPVSEEVEIE